MRVCRPDCRFLGSAERRASSSDTQLSSTRLRCNKRCRSPSSPVLSGASSVIFTNPAASPNSAYSYACNKSEVCPSRSAIKRSVSRSNSSRLRVGLPLPRNGAKSANCFRMRSTLHSMETRGFLRVVREAMAPPMEWRGIPDLTPARLTRQDGVPGSFGSRFHLPSWHILEFRCPPLPIAAARGGR